MGVKVITDDFDLEKLIENSVPMSIDSLTIKGFEEDEMENDNEYDDLK